MVLEEIELQKRKIRSWLKTLSHKQLESIIYTIHAIFTNTEESKYESDIKYIDPSQFGLNLVRTEDALTSAKAISNFLGIKQFLFEDDLIGITSNPFYVLGRQRGVYTYINRSDALEVLNMYFIGRKILRQNEDRLIGRQVLVLSQDKTEDKIYFQSEIQRCYKLKIKRSQRYEIIDILYSANSPLTINEIVSELNDRFKAKKDPRLIKREILNINRVFRAETDTTHDLICVEKSGRKNVYMLNKNDFTFIKEK